MGNVTALQAFRAMDVDGNRGVNAREMKQGLALAPKALRDAVRGQGAGAVIAAMDVNKDKSLSKAELAQGIALLEAQSANALLAAQEQQTPDARFAGVLKGGLYSALPGISTAEGGVSAQVLSAYMLKA